MKQPNHIWVIEIKDLAGKWVPTDESWLTRKDADWNYRELNRHQPGRYRVVKYEAVCQK